MSTTLEVALHVPAPGLTPDQESRAMFVARLENMHVNGHCWVTIAGVLALLNDCDMLASGTGRPGALT